MGRDWGTGVLTLTVTWYSRIWIETDRKGLRVARRETCFKSFINPPTRIAVVVVRDKLRPVETDVKHMTTRCCGRVWPEHNLKRKYSQNQLFSPQDVEVFSTGFPLDPRRLSTGFCTVFRAVIRSKSAHFPHLLHIFSMQNSRPLFPQLLR